MPVYTGCTRGFSVRSIAPRISPFATAFFGLPPENLEQRSRLRTSLIRRDMLHMGRNKTIIDDPVFSRVVFAAFDAFKLDTKIRPIHLNDLFDHDLDIKRSSPGLPWSEHGYKNRGEVMSDPEARTSIRWFWHKVKQGYDVPKPPDCKVLYRAHLQKEGKPKIRAVYGYPTTMTLGEASFAIPLIKAFKRGTTPIAYGYDTLKGGCNKLRNEIIKYSHFICADFKNFDKDISVQLIRYAFNILYQNIDWRYYQDDPRNGTGVPDVERLQRMWEYIVDYFIRTPLRLHTGERYLKTGGVPSGSYFTQLIDSVVNWILINYFHCLSTGTMCEVCKVFGDDSVVATESSVTKEEYAYYASSIGMTLSIEKTIQTDDVESVEFLGFKISYGFPQRPMKKWLEALYHPEYPDMTWDDFASRVLGLFYANHACNLDFSQMCRKVLTFKPFRFKISRDTERFLRVIGFDIKDAGRPLPNDTYMVTRLVV